MLISDIYKKLYDFAVSATGLPLGKVILANQSSPRPKKPFITIDVGSFRNIGTPIIKTLDTQGLQEVIVSMVFVVSFQSYSDKLHEAEDILSTLYIKFATELQNDIFKGELAMLKTLKHVTAIPTALNGEIESRAILDVEMGVNKKTTHQVGLIEKVKINNSINNSHYEVTK